MTGNSLHETLVVCLGGGVKGDGLPAHVSERVASSVKIANSSENGAVLFSSSFTLNKAVTLDAQGLPKSEASAMADYAKDNGYRGPLYCEQQSHDTIGSAYFVFSDFVSFISPAEIVVVTGDFHIERASLIFRHVATLFGYCDTLTFAATSSNMTGARIMKEADAVGHYRREWIGVSKIQDFRKKLFCEHSNDNRLFIGSIGDKEILYSY